MNPVRNAAALCPQTMAERLGMDPANFARKYGRDWHLTVAEAANVTPNMRRVVFSGADLGEMQLKPGQSVVLLLPGAGGELLKRHYTVRVLDRIARRLAIDFVLHGDTPGADWARNVRPGDEVDALGPRGHVWLHPEADWHLFAGDATALPAIAAMLEGLKVSDTATAIVEVENKAEEQELATPSGARIVWLHRNGPPRPESKALIDALAAISLPEDRVVHAYLAGETGTVRAQRRGLIARGLPKQQISAEGYWRPGRIGSHDRVDD
jgi:NADPH-dependent ferric siderophore reductase